MEERKIKRNHVLLVLLYIAVLLIPIIVFKIKNLEENNKLKEEAIIFLKDNIKELEPICRVVLKENECRKWENYSICPKTNGVLIEETGLTTVNWVLWYSMDKWYFEGKPIDSNNKIDITSDVK